jgi:hypothetical protein
MTSFCKLKPAASSKTQLLIAAMLWSLVGFVLLGFGLKWLFASESDWIWVLLLATILVGAAKGLFILRKSANRSIARIQKRGDGTCIFGVFSIWSWVLIGIMMTGGSYLRTSGLADEFLGTLYAAIGGALIMGSIYSWKAYLSKTTQVR